MNASGTTGFRLELPHCCWIAIVIIVLCLQGCSSSPEVEPPVVVQTAAEKATQLRERLLALQVKLNEQKVALKSVINNEAHLELLLRLMNAKQQEPAVASDGTTSEQQPDAATQQLNVDYLQKMAANQAALRADLAKLLQDLNALSAASH